MYTDRDELSGEVSQERLPPHDLDSEEAVLGSILIDPDVMTLVAHVLRAPDFYREKNRWVYEACEALHGRGETINQIAVAYELTRVQRLEDLGGNAYLGHLVAETPTSIHAEHYAEIVRACSVLRSVIIAGSKLRELGYSGMRDLEQVTARVQDAVAKIPFDQAMKHRVLDLKNPDEGRPPLTILDTRPRIYKLWINGNRVCFDERYPIETLKQWRLFETFIAETLRFIPIQPKDWKTTVSRLLQEAEIEHAAEDASEESQVWFYLRSWLRQAAMEDGFASDLDVRPLHLCVRRQWRYCFKTMPFLNYLAKIRAPVPRGNKLTHLLKEWGAEVTKSKIKGVSVHCYYLLDDAITRQENDASIQLPFEDDDEMEPDDLDF